MFMSVLTIIVFLLVLSVLVLVHEFGHFIVGRLEGIGVEEFALGLPFTKSLISRKLKGGMKLSLYPVLFGGFVKLLGEEGEEENKNNKINKTIKGIAFYEAGVWQRIAVVVAGVLMNLVLAVVVFYIFLLASGFKVLIPKLADYQFISPHQTKVIIASVQKGSPAETAGIKPGDVAITADNQQITGLKQFQTFTRENVGKQIDLVLADTSLTNYRTVAVTPRANPPKGEGPLGISIGEAEALSYPTTGEKLLSGVSYTADMFIYNFRILGKFISDAIKTGNTEPLSESVSGPVGIASAVGTILDLGGSRAVIQLVNLLGLLSLSLAFMNVLPFPALDGGRLAFLLVEAFAGKKLAAKHENLINQIGMAVLLAFILLVSFNDVVKIISPLFPGR